MPRYERNTVILSKVETTAGIDAVPTGAADAVLVSDRNITPLNSNNVDRNLVRSYFGASEQLVANASVKMDMTVELAGSGTAGTAPQWGDLMIGCGFAEAVLSAPNRVEYTPISTALKTLSQYYHDDGVLHKLLGSMGNFKMSAKVGDIGKLIFSFIGLDGGISAASATPTLSAWKTPVTIAKANVVDITLGCTYSAGALAGGTVYSSTGLELDIGNSVKYTPLLSNETIDITDRNVSGSIELDLTAANEVSFMATVKANTTQSLAFTVGTVAGNKIIIYAPAVQLINPKKVDKDGRRLIGYDLRLVPTPGGSGNDELRIVCL